jgi:hypothetical protein
MGDPRDDGVPRKGGGTNLFGGEVGELALLVGCRRRIDARIRGLAQVSRPVVAIISAARRSMIRPSLSVVQTVPS